MALKQWLLAGLLASTCLVSLAAAGPIENYSPVTADRLKNPEDRNREKQNLEKQKQIGEMETNGR